MKQLPIPSQAVKRIDGSRVLVFVPYPGDEIFGCGGAILCHVATEDAVRVIVVSDGGLGVDEENRAEHARIRQDECSAAAALLGYGAPEFWMARDIETGYGEKLVGLVLEAMRQAEADLVYAPSVFETQPEHRDLGLAVVEAVRRLGQGVRLALYEAGMPLHPNLLLDIGALVERKQLAMECYASSPDMQRHGQHIAALNNYRSYTLPAEVTAAEAYLLVSCDELAQDPLELFRLEHDRQQAPDNLDKPLVSIIIRSMDRPVLSDALDSVALQTYPNIEVVLVNAKGEGHRDLGAWCGRFPLALVGTGEKMRRSRAANLGLESAGGEYLIFLDDDDWFEPDHIEKLVEAIEENPQVKVVYRGVRCVDEKNNPLSTAFAMPFDATQLMAGNYIPFHALLFSSTLLGLGCRVDESIDLYEDWDFLIQLSNHTDFLFIGGLSAVYRITPQSGFGVNGNPAEVDRATLMIYKKWHGRLQDGQIVKTMKSVWLNRDKDQQLLDKDRHIENLNKISQDMGCALQEKDQHIENLSKIGQKLEYALQEKDQHIENLDKIGQNMEYAMLEKDQHIKNLERITGEQDQSISSLERIAGEQYQHISNLEGTIRDRDQYISSFERKILEQDRHIGDLLREKENSTSGFNHALWEKDQHIHNIHQVLAAHEQQLINKENLILTLINSTSWRLTEPLRLAGRQARKTYSLFQSIRIAARRAGGVTRLMSKAIRIYKHHGLSGIIRRFDKESGNSTPTLDAPASDGVANVENYQEWISRYDALNDLDFSMLKIKVYGLKSKPVISILLPVFNTPEILLQKAIESVFSQVYPYWELCIADDASTMPHVERILKEYQKRDTRIKVAFREANGHIAAATNSALELAIGEFVALMDHDDELATTALYWVAKEICDQPDLAMLYSDEDKIGLDGERCEPYFKPDWNPNLLLSQNYVCHLTIYRTGLVKEVGGFRTGYDGAQDYDLVLRVTERLEASQICHIPKILYHWRKVAGSTALGGTDEKPYSVTASLRALNDRFERIGVSAVATEAGSVPGMYRAHFSLPDSPPLVTLIIPTRNGLKILRQCIRSILEKTDYPNYEILVIDNNSDDPETIKYFLELERDKVATVLRDERPFNFSALNNNAVQHARGSIVGLLNNDVEVISRSWLSEMVSHALRPEIGAVGARLWYPNNTLQHGGVILVCGVAGHAHKYLPKGEYGHFGRAALLQNFSAVTAACMVLRKSVYQQVGGIDEALAVAFNDVDFCLRIRKAGYLNLWTPYAELYHHESVTRGHEDSPEKQARFNKEVDYMQLRWGNDLLTDPAYNPNLAWNREDFSLAWPPRIEKYY